MLNRRRRLLLGGAVALPLVAGCGPERGATAGVPRSPFDAESTAEDVTNGIDLTGKIAVVTGCTSGIGLETMRVLALRGAYVLGTSRSLARAEQACRGVAGVTSPLALDLADPESVIACAELIRSLRAPIDILVCNAGYRGGGNDRETVHGVEKHFAVNHLGHFLLVNRIIDRMYFAWQGRIVVVASRTAYTKAPAAGILFDDLAFTREYSDSAAYGHSKLANVLFSLGLAERLRGTRITSNALHPGVVDTGIDRNLNGVVQRLFGLYAAVRGKSVAQGAATSCYVATSPALGATSGAYFEDCDAVTIAATHLYDKDMSDRLWAASESLLADYLVVHGEPDPAELEHGLRRWRKDAG